MIDLRKIFVNTIWFGVIPQLGNILTILLLPIIVPHLTPADFGLWGIVSAYVALAIAFCPLGLHIHLPNSFYEYGKKYIFVWRRLLGCVCISSLVVSIILGGIIYSKLGTPSGKNLFLITLLCVIPVLFYPNIMLTTNYYVLNARPKVLAVCKFLSAICGISVMTVSICYFKVGWLGYVLNVAVFNVVCFLLFLVPLWAREKIYPVFRFKFDWIFAQLKIAFPVIIHTFGLTFLTSSTRIILNHMGVQMHDIGIYSNGYIIGNYVNLLPVAMVTAMVPFVQKSYRSGDYKNFFRLYMVLQLTTLIFVFLFSLFMKEFYFIFVKNQSLHAAIPVAQISAFISVYFPIYSLLSTIAIVDKMTWSLLWLALLPAILNVVFCLFFIPVYGAACAPWLLLISYSVQTLIPMISPYFRKKVQSLMRGYKLFAFMLNFIFAVSLFVSLYLIDIFWGYKLTFMFTTMIIFLVFISKNNNFRTIIGRLK